MLLLCSEDGNDIYNQQEKQRFLKKGATINWRRQQPQWYPGSDICSKQWQTESSINWR